LTGKIRGLEDEFLKGINVHSPESRDHCQETIDFLRGTPIEWVRIHPIPSRRLRARGPSGISHLDSIEKFAEAGFNLVIPIDVGVKENVGVITGARLRSFVDESYGESYKAVKQIESRVSKYDRRIIYGVENEIDTKEWVLQSLPNIAWRQETLAWLELSVNKEMKFKRLAHILDGIKEASPNSLTMLNFEADDPVEDWNLQTSFMLAVQTVFSKLGFLEKGARHRMNNYRLDVMEATRRLRSCDIIGLDNYPNYFRKFPPRGQDIGNKVNYVARLTRKPVINVEFGYTRVGANMSSEDLEKNANEVPRNLATGSIPSPEELQKQFYRNALNSIENSSSQGTFPWVLYLDYAHYYKPKEENGFSLLNLGSNRMFEPVPALDLYLNWLDGIETREKEEEARAAEERKKEIRQESLSMVEDGEEKSSEKNQESPPATPSGLRDS
jgi:hypothetical protein